MTRSRPGLRLLLVSALVMGGVALGDVQNYPSKPIRLVLPSGPGAIMDYVGRTLSQKLSENIGQPVIVENRPGARGTAGTDSVARSAPDGYTLVLMDAAIVVNPILQADSPYDPFKNLQTVSIVSSSPEVLVGALSLPVKTVQDLVAYGNANPGKLRYASAGFGTPSHLTAELFKLRTGIDAMHVPYKGIGASYTDLMEGKVHIAFSSMAAALPFTNSNQVRALATTGAKRTNVYPDLPTVAESGLPGFEVDLWLGVFAPAGLPGSVLGRLNSELKRALHASDVVAALAKLGIDPRGSSPEEGASFVRSEFEKWRRVIKDGKIN